MTDVPPDSTGTGPEPAEPSEPPVVRRSNFAPPPPGTEPPRFDDDALAEAMAAEVRPYTMPITLPKAVPPQAEAAIEEPAAAPEVPTVAPEAPAAVPRAAQSWNGLPMAADTTPAPSTPPAPAPDDAEDEMLRSLGGASTLEAIERLENELRLLSNGESTTLDLSSSPTATEDALAAPVNAAETSAVEEPMPPVAETSEPAVAEPALADAPEPAPAVAPVAEPVEGDPEPALDHPAPGHFFPAAFEPIAPSAPPPGPPGAPEAEEPQDPTGLEPPTPSRSPGLLEVDESLIDPAAVAELRSALPEPVETAVSEPMDGVWDLAAPVGSEKPRIAEAPPVESPPAEPPAASPFAPPPAPELPAPELLAVSPFAPPPPPEPPAAEPPAAEPPAVSRFAPPPLAAPAPELPSPELPSPELPTPALPAAEPSAPEPTPVQQTPVPISTEPPVGPEAPDWLDAPPPSYEPQELIEPPVFFPSADPLVTPPSSPDTEPDAPPAEGEAAAPLSPGALSSLRKPLPTQQPRLEDRAELPPPPGYENIPIVWGDIASATPPIAPDLIFPPAPAPPPLADGGLIPTGIPAAMPASAPEEMPSPSSAAMPPLASAEMPAATETSTLDNDEDDVIDAIDRVSGGGAIPVSVSGAAADPLSPPSEPVATSRLAVDEPALVDEKPHEPPAFEVESAGPEPTALDMRAGRAARLFWLWFAANSSVLSLGLGAVLLGTGMSLRQAIVAALAGVAISFLPLGLGTLAGKWSGQPTMIVSRATFGHAGNILPALLAVVTRVLWGGVLLWLLASAVAQVLVGAGLDAGLGTTVWQLVGLVAGFVIATVVAVFGYGFVAKLQLVLSIVSAALIVGAGLLTFQHLNFAAALTVPDGSWILVIGGAALVFGVVGLAWVQSSSDLARYQRPASYGGSSMLWATFGATLPPFALIVWGAMLAASDPKLAKGLSSNPLAAIASLLPSWYPAPLLAAAALGLLSGAVLTMYSGGFAIQALGVRARRGLATLISAILVLAVAAALVFVVTDFGSLVRDLVITVAVPVAAWAGILSSEMMIRTRRFHADSLLAPGGLYPQVRWLNFVALIVISVIGFGLVTSGIPGLGWEGFLYGLVGIGAHDPIANSEAGVFVALLLGLLVPLIGGVPAIRKQERSPVPA